MVRCNEAGNVGEYHPRTNVRHAIPRAGQEAGRVETGGFQSTKGVAGAYITWYEVEGVEDRAVGSVAGGGRGVADGTVGTNIQLLTTLDRDICDFGQLCSGTVAGKELMGLSEVSSAIELCWLGHLKHALNRKQREEDSPIFTGIPVPAVAVKAVTAVILALGNMPWVPLLPSTLARVGRPIQRWP